MGNHLYINNNKVFKNDNIKQKGLTNLKFDSIDVNFHHSDMILKVVDGNYDHKNKLHRIKETSGTFFVISNEFTEEKLKTKNTKKIVYIILAIIILIVFIFLCNKYGCSTFVTIMTIFDYIKGCYSFINNNIITLN